MAFLAALGSMLVLAATGTADPRPGGWYFRTTENLMDDSTRFSALKRQAGHSFVLWCDTTTRGRRIMAEAQLDEIVGGDDWYPVKYRLDKGAVTSMPWVHALRRAGGSSIAPRTDADMDRFINDIGYGSRLIFQPIDPDSLSSPITYVFDLSGLKEIIEELRAKCAHRPVK